MKGRSQTWRGRVKCEGEESNLNGTSQNWKGIDKTNTRLLKQW